MLIGEVADAWQDLWDCRQVVEVDTIEIWQGWPQGLPRGKGGSGGPSWVLTSELADKYKSMQPRETIPHFAQAGYPFGKFVIKKHRKMLGIDRVGQAEKFWLDRFDDLGSLGLKEFVSKHSVAAQSVLDWRKRLGIDNRRNTPFWWQEPEAISVLSSDAALSWIADKYSVSVARVQNIRTQLRKQGNKIKDRRNNGKQRIARQATKSTTGQVAASQETARRPVDRKDHAQGR